MALVFIVYGIIAITSIIVSTIAWFESPSWSNVLFVAVSIIGLVSLVVAILNQFRANNSELQYVEAKDKLIKITKDRMKENLNSVESLKKFKQEQK